MSRTRKTVSSEILVTGQCVIWSGGRTIGEFFIDQEQVRIAHKLGRVPMSAIIAYSNKPTTYPEWIEATDSYIILKWETSFQLYGKDLRVRLVFE